MQKLQIGHIPAVLYDTGSQTERVCLFVHGKCGRKEEAAEFSPLLAEQGIAALAIDLPDHGERQGKGEILAPWTAVPDIAAAYDWLCARYAAVSLYAISIGAYFSMLALMGRTVERAYFESPVLSMTRLIEGMMAASGVTAAELEKQGEIPTDFGETLSWRYYTYAKSHPLTDWCVPTSILWADGDALTDRGTAESFAAEHSIPLHVAKGCAHCFHTPEALRIRKNWRMAVRRTIRQATETDVPAIRALYAAAKTMPDTTWNAYYPGDEEIAADLASGGLYVWEDADAVVGAVSVAETDALDALAVFAGDQCTHRSISRLVIDPVQQGHGYAAYFLTELFARLHREGVEEIRLLAAKCNRAANATYTRLGFQYLGTCTMYGVDFHVCRKTL